MDYDLITVGGGLAGAALARALAERGARVLVLERETRFRDRVRGEGMHPWGVAEARALGLDQPLREAGAHEVRWFHVSEFGAGEPHERDLLATTPHRTGELDFYHPAMQEALLGAAAAAGAEVRRGATAVGVTPGVVPRVTVRADGGATETLRARLVVGADGRASRVRGWAGFAVEHDPARLVIAGVLLDGVRLPADAVRVVGRAERGQGMLAFPLGDGRFRVYFLYYRTGPPRRLSGRQHLGDFVAACVETGADPAWFAGAEAAGPLAAFEGADTWVEHPYRDGVALVGDAAAASDPSFGCGLSLTLRDVRVLRDHLLACGDWRTAGHGYAAEHDRYYGALHRIERWRTALLEPGPAGDARRAWERARRAAEPKRTPDLIGLGPDGPNEEAEVRPLS